MHKFPNLCLKSAVPTFRVKSDNKEIKSCSIDALDIRMLHQVPSLTNMTLNYSLSAKKRIASIKSNWVEIQVLTQNREH